LEKSKLKSSSAVITDNFETAPLAPITSDGGNDYRKMGVFGADKIMRINFRETSAISASAYPAIYFGEIH